MARLGSVRYKEIVGLDQQTFHIYLQRLYAKPNRLLLDLEVRKLKPRSRPIRAERPHLNLGICCDLFHIWQFSDYCCRKSFRGFGEEFRPSFWLAT